MYYFHLLFPEIGDAETRTARLAPAPDPPQKNDLPPGEYAFVELYCVDPKCDCRRVLINVLHNGKTGHVATISHAFEPPPIDSHTLEQTYLDPLHKQSRWAEDLIDLFVTVLLKDRAYEARLRRHYRMVKDAIADPRHPIHGRIPASPFAPRPRKPQPSWLPPPRKRRKWK